MIKRNKKVQVIEAWGWFIRILGHYSLKCRYLVNELLKIPEQTFSDPDPQVQVATQVSFSLMTMCIILFVLLIPWRLFPIDFPASFILFLIKVFLQKIQGRYAHCSRKMSSYIGIKIS